MEHRKKNVYKKTGVPQFDFDSELKHLKQQSFYICHPLEPDQAIGRQMTSNCGLNKEAIPFGDCQNGDTSTFLYSIDKVQFLESLSMFSHNFDSFQPLF